MNKDFMTGYEYAKQTRREKFLHRLIQQIAGVGLAALGILSIPVTNNDITVALIFVPAGLYVAFSSEVFIGK